MSQDDSLVPLPVPHDFSPRLPHKDHLAFVEAIHECKYVRVTFHQEENEAIPHRNAKEQICAPWDYAPMIYNNAISWRYKFVQRDEESWVFRMRQFDLLPGQIIHMEKLAEDFEPMELMFKPGTTWCIHRDWHFPRRKP